MKKKIQKFLRKKGHIFIPGAVLIIVTGFLVGAYFFIATPKEKNVDDVLGSFEDAIKEFYIDYDKLSINPNNHPRPDELLNKIREEEAKLSDEDPDNDRTAYELIAFNSRTLGDEEGAIRGYRASLALFPNNTLILNNIATSYKDLEEYKKAEAAYKKIIELSPGTVTAYRNLADLYLHPELDKKDTIPTIIESGLASAPNDPDLLSYLAVYYKDEKNYSKAIEYYERLIKVNPKNEAAKQDLSILKVLVN